MRLRIAYGVHGYGRGHATRALAILPELTRRHEVLLLAGGDAYDALSGRHEVTRIPHLRYVYGRPGKVSLGLTLKRNLSSFLDVKLRGHGVQMVIEALRSFEPDVVLADSDAWTLRAARTLGLGRISLDHYGILVYCRPPVGALTRLALGFESLAYQALMGFPERKIVSAFFPAEPKRPGITVVGPLLRPAVLEAAPAAGEHLLVYFSSGRLHFTAEVEAALGRLGAPVVIYNRDREERRGNLDFRRLDNAAFVRDLASCRAVFATAGNQLIGEAMHFGKPVFVLPEDSLEQRVNAEVVERLGIGRRTTDRRFSFEALQAFWSHVDAFAANVRRHARNGLAEAVDAVERYAEELTGLPRTVK